MNSPKTFTEAEAEHFFAIQFHGKTWELLDKPDHTAEEKELLKDYAHASLAHWRVAGTPLNEQRGLWMLSRIYNVLGQVESALYYAQRCQELTLRHKDLMQDFDIAFAFEALARAHALAGDNESTHKYLIQAKEAGNNILDKEDLKIFLGDLNGGNWHGLK